MAGYTQKWDCRICKEEQDTDGVPKLRTCEKCLAELANYLCTRKLNHSIDHPGIDRAFWMREAEQHVRFLFSRWKEVRLAVHV